MSVQIRSKFNFFVVPPPSENHISPIISPFPEISHYNPLFNVESKNIGDLEMCGGWVWAGVSVYVCGCAGAFKRAMNLLESCLLQNKCGGG
jgi:hypothetical protein